MKRTVEIIILILIFTYHAAGQDRYKWEKIDAPTEQYVRLISFKSADEFIIYDIDCNLYERLNGKWKVIKSPLTENFSGNSICKTADGNFHLISRDNEWRSHFFKFNGENWTESNYIHPVPIAGLLPLPDSSFFAYGNFGSLLKIKNNETVIIKNPFTSHIQDGVIINSNEIYFLSNTEGVYRYDGSNFTQVPFDIHPKSGLSSYFNLSIKNDIYVTDMRGNNYKLINMKFVKVHESEVNKIWQVDDLGVRRFTFYNKNDELQHINVPPIYPVISLEILPDGTLLVPSSEGKIYHVSKTEKNYFINLSRAALVEGPPDSYPRYGSFIDIQGDGLIDIFAMETKRRELPILYSNNLNSPFTNISVKLNLPKNNRIICRALFDYDNDGSTDIIIGSTDTAGSRITFYKNIKGDYFEHKNMIRIPQEISGREFFNFTPVDFDADGDIDLCLTFYYGPGSEVGAEYIIENKWFGTQWEFTSKYKSFTRSWNLRSIFADFNGDDLIDWFTINKWRKNRLLINSEKGFTDRTESNFASLEPTESKCAGAVDFDNDGDLDLIISSDQKNLQLFENDGGAFFKDVSKRLGLSELSFINIVEDDVALNFGDFNNDSFTDILVRHSGKNLLGNKLFINDSAKQFVDRTAQYFMEDSPGMINLVGDIDNDGDLDIYSLRTGFNALWINNQDDDNFLLIKPVGVTSNPDGLGAKIWIYLAGHLGDDKYLRGFKQIGSYQFTTDYQDDLTAHFGLSSNNRYDVRVKFYGGSEVDLKNVAAGQRLIVKEHNKMVSFFTDLPRVVFTTIIKKEVQLYFLTVMIAIMIIYFGVKLGIDKFKWEIKFSVIIIGANLSLVWILILLTLDSDYFLSKYILPLAASSAGIFLPHLLFFLNLKYSASAKSREDLKDELLQLLISFSHGEWALRNINSLHLLLGNCDEENIGSVQYLNQLKSRINTFKELTAGTIKKIEVTARAIDFQKKLISELSEINIQLNNFFDQILEKKSELSDNLIRNKSVKLNTLKTILTKLRNEIFADYSCNAVEVIQKITEVYSESSDETNITVFHSLNMQNQNALINNFELADVIDNLIKNALKAIIDSDEKQINISIYRKAPKIIIDVKDTGKGIEEKYWDEIFKRGYSGSSGTGEGLFISRAIISKYGGRIFVLSSVPAKGTIFTIELNEGKK